MTSPSGLAAAGVGAAGALAIGLGPIGMVIFGAFGWGARVAVAAVPRSGESTAIDPFALHDPWRSFVWEARKGQRRFNEATRRVRSGPLRTRLDELGARIDAAVDEVWKIARAGQALAEARKHIDVDRLERELTELAATPELAGATTALEGQLSSARRLDTTIADTRGRLRVLDARLREAVTRAVELSVHEHGPERFAGLDHDVELLVAEMEAMRAALDHRSAGNGPAQLDGGTRWAEELLRGTEPETEEGPDDTPLPGT